MVADWSRKIDQLQMAPKSTSGVKIDPELIEELLARLFQKTKGAEGYAFYAPGSQNYRTQYDQQSTQEEWARKRREEEARWSKERERQQQESERTRREAKERRKREEEKRRKEEQEARDKEAREREERNERIRQKAEQARKERERKPTEQAAKAREDWDKAWLQYVREWDDLKKKSAKGTSEKLREIIPWPVKSSDWRDVSDSAVEEFFWKAPPHTNSPKKMLAIMNMECLKWHADRIPRMFGSIEDKALADLFKTVSQVVIKIRIETAR